MQHKKKKLHLELVKKYFGNVDVMDEIHFVFGGHQDKNIFDMHYY